MGLFKSIGKLFKKVAKVALPVLKLGTSFIPGVGGVVGSILSSKVGSKGVALFKGGTKVSKMVKAFPGVTPPATTAVAQPLIAMKVSHRHAHKVASHPLNRKKSATKKRTTKKRTMKKHATKKRRSSGRKLKFGSPAWQKKYNPKRR